MVRIFIVLACLAWLSLVANFAAGLWIGDFNAVAKTYREAYNKDLIAGRDHSLSDEQKQTARAEYTQASKDLVAPRKRMTIHFYLGVAACILVILVNSITVTYFVGTSRWCKEVGETYDLSNELQLRSTAIKRRTFPWAFAGMLAMVGLALLGGLSDPSIPINQAQPERSAGMVMWHYMAAMTALAFIALTFTIQAIRMSENFQAIQDILAEVHRIRVEKGLPTKEEVV
ncbi:hypothetical protein [Anatilimnocola floriformis]|uniref:hypothetical protein n=1 Tax=Anatilimnocola floriformis TaxID=2948575 RepID=UPI0020C4701B|nr:hypothetical protein [Anatilimnocola floriformis]